MKESIIVVWDTFFLPIVSTRYEDEQDVLQSWLKTFYVFFWLMDYWFTLLFLTFNVENITWAKILFIPCFFGYFFFVAAVETMVLNMCLFVTNRIHSGMDQGTKIELKLSMGVILCLGVTVEWWYFALYLNWNGV